MRNVCARYDAGEPNAILAIDMWGYVLRKYIGSFIAAMGGVDCVVFTAGVGENNGDIRAEAVEGLEFMGIAVDPVKNHTRGTVDVTAEGGRVKVLVIPTDEEFVIASDTEEIVKAL